VALGDYSYDLPFGSLTTNCRFRDSYIAVIKAIQANYPEAKIIIILGDHVTGEYATSVEDIAKHYEIPYVDFRDDKNVTKYSGSHPNYNGMKYMAKKIYEETQAYLFN
jgi:ribosomal protein L7Ae-like RNA K-turn-binding protein